MIDLTNQQNALTQWPYLHTVASMSKALEHKDCKLVFDFTRSSWWIVRDTGEWLFRVDYVTEFMVDDYIREEYFQYLDWCDNCQVISDCIDGDEEIHAEEYYCESCMLEKQSEKRWGPR